MSREEVQKLLGGYATGTLTAEEQQALFAAALDDQELFDALAREQAVRDVLRDPAARAQLLSALDERPRRGFWGWLQPPVIAGLAMAGIAAIAVVAWQASKPSAAPVQVAEVKAPVPPPQQPPRVEPPAAPAEPSRRVELARAKPVKQTEQPRNKDKAAEVADAAQIALSAPPPPPPARSAPARPAVTQAQAVSGQLQQAAAPPPQAQQGQLQDARVREDLAVQAFKSDVELSKTAAPENARQLFFAGQPGVAGNAFAPSGGGGGGSAKKALANTPLPAVPGAAGILGGVIGAGSRLGLRCSLLRDGKEVDVTTPLNAGESVKLHVTPNTDGFLYVYEGERLVASGPARRMQAFDTPDLKSDAPGQKQFRVVLSRLQATFGAVDSLKEANLVERAGAQDPGTYSVTRDAAPAQPGFSMPVTVTWH